MRNMRRVSIVMTYYERAVQLAQTLRSFQDKKYENYEVIVVDDASPTQPADPEELKQRFPALDLKIISVSGDDKDYLNPSVPFNMGFRVASGDIVIIQNAECLHLDDILSHARTHLTDENYLAYGCFSLNEEESRRLWSGNGAPEEIRAFIKDRSATSDGDSGWYNHSIYRPEAYHFTAAITKANLDKLGGFDERYAPGIGYDDNELLFRIKREGLRIGIVDEAISIHQWHYGFPKNPRFDYYFSRNHMIFKWITKKESYLGERGGRHRALSRFYPVIYPLRRFNPLKKAVGRMIRFRNDCRIHSRDTFRYYRLKKSKLLRRCGTGRTTAEFQGKDTPIIINSFNRLHYLNKMIDRLEEDGYRNIVILDNNSTYPPLLEFFEKTPHKVIRLRRNRGYLAVWYAGECASLTSGYYVYTDPDILPEKNCPGDYLERFHSLLERYPDVDKVGFSLEVDSPDIREEFVSHIRNHEDQHWRWRRDDGSFDAPTDTTFALYRPGIGGGFWLKALRTDRPYTARHLPWHEDDDPLLVRENEYYAWSVARSTHWSTRLHKKNGRETNPR